MQLQSMVKEAVTAALENVDFPTYTSSMNELKKKVDELSKRWKIIKILNLKAICINCA